MIFGISILKPPRTLHKVQSSNFEVVSLECMNFEEADPKIHDSGCYSIQKAISGQSSTLSYLLMTLPQRSVGVKTNGTVELLFCTPSAISKQTLGYVLLTGRAEKQLGLTTH